MKYKNGLTFLAGLLFAAIMLNAAPTAQAGQCSFAGAAGKYGFTVTGTLLLPTGPVPAAAVGRVTLKADGTISGTEARNVGGSFANETLTGTFTVNPDCTGTATFKVFDESGALVRTTVVSSVFDDKMNQLRLVQQSLTLPDGTNVPVVITADAKKISTPEEPD